MHVVASRYNTCYTEAQFSSKKKPSCISEKRFPNRGQALDCSYKFRGLLFKYNWWFTCTGEQGGETLKMQVDSACCKDFKRCEAQQKPGCISKDRCPNRGQALGAATNFAAFYSNTTGDLHALGNREGKPWGCDWIVHVVKYARYSKGARHNKKGEKRVLSKNSDTDF